MNSKILSRTLFILTGFLIQSNLNAQLYVGPNSYVFASNEVVFINQQLELNAVTSNFYLRENAQLLQGTTAAGTNKGLGSLSVFQEGTTNNFQYNYWCSPVGGSIATAGNYPFGITQLKDVDGLITFKEPLILSMNNYNGTASPLAIAPFWIYKLIASSDYSSWVPVGSSSNIKAGEGFTMKGSSGTNSFTLNGVQNNSGSKQRYDFRGKPNDGTIAITVATDQFTLTGNPYPSAIDLKLFLLDATNTTGIAYFWEHDKTANSHYIDDYRGGYGAYSPLGGAVNGANSNMGVYTPATFYSYDGKGNQVTDLGSSGNVFERRFSPVGQGFMLDGIADGIVEMKNSYRVFVKENVLNFSQFERSTSSNKTKNTDQFLPIIQSVSGFDYTKVSTKPVPQIRFNILLNDQGIRQLVLALVPDATDGVDHAMDAMLAGDSAGADVYFAMNESKFVIDARPFNLDTKISIGFKNDKPANYKITVKEILNFTEAEIIYLHDIKSDKYFDIKNDFHELSLPSGVNNTQFEITFKNNSSLGVDEGAVENFIIHQNNTTKQLKISNPLLLDLSTCGLYDVAGKLIFDKEKLGTSTNYEFSTVGLRDGIYIVKLVTKDKITAGYKIIVKN
jgi:hypothetical protein